MEKSLAAALIAAACCLPAHAELTNARCVRDRHEADAPAASCYAVRYDGTKRTLRVYVPAGHGGPLPVVLVLHGAGGTGGGMEWLTGGGFDRIADRDGAIVVYPDGIGHSWNDGRPDVNSRAVGEHVDDVGFLAGLARELGTLHAVDLARVYVTGISNGGLMSYRLACDAARVFAAAAAVAANFSTQLAPQCNPDRPIPVLIMNGTEDPIMPWNGGAVRVLWLKHGTVLSAPDTAARWLALDHCAPLAPRGAPLTAVPEDGTAAQLHSASCSGEAAVQLYEIRGGGHTWPGGKPYLSARLIGRVSHALDANQVVWGFFRQHRLP